MEPGIKLKINEWKAKSRKYFELAEKEQDVIGKKYYSSYATALVNCIDDISEVFGINNYEKKSRA